MIIISHRGNIDGPSNSENHPTQISKALELGFDCEVDVWYKNNNYFLGHDEPMYDVGVDFLKNKNLWCHAKNLEALEKMMQDKIHCFWHQNDDFTLTSEGHIWTYPEKQVCEKSIIVQNKKQEIQYNCLGICTDYPEFYALKYNETE